MNKPLTLKDITSWTCKCNCVTFDNGKYRKCGSSPKYGEIDYDDLREEAIKLLATVRSDKWDTIYHSNPLFVQFFDITEDELENIKQDNSEEVKQC